MQRKLRAGGWAHLVCSTYSHQATGEDGHCFRVLLPVSRPIQPQEYEPVWMADVAAFLLAGGAAGLPLTHAEARSVQQQYLLSVEHYRGFAFWDPWDESVPDGDFGYKPDRGLGVRPTELSYLLEYCYSPLRNIASAPLVDCEVVANPERWGQ